MFFFNTEVGRWTRIKGIVLQTDHPEGMKYIVLEEYFPPWKSKTAEQHVTGEERGRCFALLAVCSVLQFVSPIAEGPM